jgi:hypothetical protein
VYWRARDSESGNRKSDNGKSNAMNAIDPKQKILDAVDANFDAQLATTNEYVDLDSLRPPRCSRGMARGGEGVDHRVPDAVQRPSRCSAEPGPIVVDQDGPRTSSAPQGRCAASGERSG